MRKKQVCPCQNLRTAPTRSCVFVCVVLSPKKEKKKGPELIREFAGRAGVGWTLTLRPRVEGGGLITNNLQPTQTTREARVPCPVDA